MGAVPTVTPVPADHPEVERLVAALLHELAERYDDDSETIARTDPGASWVLLLDDDGTAVGCGAVQRLSKSVPGAPDDHGEIKRVFVERKARGRGLSRVLMDALLDVARGRGCTWLQLETGDVQPEAIGLYESSGWHRVPNYGQYVDDPRSVCFGRSLVER
ncbi:MAG: GNAT family N-acetyltransferase [Candidatus Nanopelagicales bacterium]